MKLPNPDRCVVDYVPVFVQLWVMNLQFPYHFKVVQISRADEDNTWFST